MTNSNGDTAGGKRVRKPRRIGPYAPQAINDLLKEGQFKTQVTSPTVITEGAMDAKTLAQMADVFRGIMESIPQTLTLEKKALSVKEVCAYVGGITSPTYYDKIFPEVPSYTIGRRRYTLKSDLDAYLESRKWAE